MHRKKRAALAGVIGIFSLIYSFAWGGYTLSTHIFNIHYPQERQVSLYVINNDNETVKLETHNFFSPDAEGGTNPDTVFLKNPKSYDLTPYAFISPKKIILSKKNDSRIVRMRFKLPHNAPDGTYITRFKFTQIPTPARAKTMSSKSSSGKIAVEIKPLINTIGTVYLTKGKLPSDWTLDMHCQQDSNQLKLVVKNISVFAPRVKINLQSRQSNTNEKLPFFFFTFYPETLSTKMISLPQGTHQPVEIFWHRENDPGDVHHLTCVQEPFQHAS